LSLKYLVGFVFSSFFIMFTAIAAENTQHNFQKDISISNQECTSCHQQPENDWQQSDHAKSMAVSDKNSVLANFGNVDVEHYGQKAHFLLKITAIK
jgi:formate-dependent nitrite reductase cytochrome c552 subunit